jgi:hypothetical protein
MAVSIGFLLALLALPFWASCTAGRKFVRKFSASRHILLDEVMCLLERGEQYVCIANFYLRRWWSEV